MPHGDWFFLRDPLVLFTFGIMATIFIAFGVDIVRQLFRHPN